MAEAKRGADGKFIPSEDKPKRQRTIQLYGSSIDVVLKVIEQAYFDKKTTSLEKKVLGQLMGKLQ